MQKSIMLSAITLSMLMAQPTLAGTPKGKPFIEIQGQIIEVQNDITSIEADLDAAVERIETNEGKIAYMENQITELQAKDLALGVQIDAVMAQAYENNLDIQALFSDLDAIDIQIAALRADVDVNGILSQYNADEIVRLEALQAANKDLIAANIDGLSSLVAEVDDIHEFMASVEEDILSLQTDLADKQDMIDGSCHGLSAIQSIEADGSVNCVSTNEHEFVFTTTINQSKNKTLAARTGSEQYWYCAASWFGHCTHPRYHWVWDAPVYGTVDLYCPSDVNSRFARLSSSYSSGGLVVYSHYPLGDNGYRLNLRNDTAQIRTATLKNSCIGSYIPTP